MPIKLIVLDLDGTLLKNRWKVHPKNLVAIQKTQDKGIKVIIATGRAPSSTIDIAKACLIHEQTGHIICYNGGNIIDITKENKMDILYEKSLSTEQIQAIIKFANDNNLAIWGYSTDNKTGLINRSSLRVKIMENFNHLPSKQIDETTTEGMYKILLFCKKKKQVNPILEKLNDIKDLELATSSHSVIEINPLGVNKATAVQFLCKKWGIKADEVLACGDGMNDYKLIQWVKYGIAMKNGHPNLKLAAYDVTTKNTCGGVAKAIDKYVFPISEFD
ncbi:HAD family hydrolase [Spiroplasma sp. AdecLV25b]|uniref:HAD family hydrolase n=1 Tax=Spiroplasma sp. AdecLV25b TaxID=3027162 RepID=UPI0027DEADAD|nr:HAD family hydrolase [Spiroplasma sp. AdecLV25b]